MALTRWRWLAIHDRETSLVDLIRILNLRLRQLADFLATGGNGSAADEINAVEAYLWNAGDPLVAGDSDWVFVPFSFTITLAEIVADIAGSLVVDVYASSYSAWSGFTLISGAAPITLAGVAKAHPPLTGWTKTFSGGTYLRFTVSGTPVTVRKATISLELTLPNSVLVSDTGVMVSGAAGGVLSGTYPNPGFAEDMATQAELNIESAARVSGDAAERAYAIQRANHTGTQTASTISDFNSASRAQTEAEILPGTNITITPAGSGASRTLTIDAASASAGSILASYWSNTTLVINPDTAADTIITGMSATFTVAGSTNVLIRFGVRAAKNGYMVLSLYESGVKLAPLSGGGVAPPPNGWYVTGLINGAERLNQQGLFEMGYTFAAGTHTVDVYHAASLNLNSISFFERTLTIAKL